MTKSALVTGGAGFIGSALARRLLKDGYAVTILDNLSTGDAGNVPDGARFIEGDVSDNDAVCEAFGDGHSVVAHLAAQSSGAVGQEDPEYDARVNALATVQISRRAIETETLRFVYTSSMAVYGDAEGPMKEGDLPTPRGYYGASKLASEHYLRVAGLDGLRATSFRLFNVYGPGQNLKNLKQGMASIYLAYMLDGVPVPVTGSFDRYRDFVFIDDVVDVLSSACGSDGLPSPVYNVGTGTPTTVRELISSLKRGLGLPEDYPVHEVAGQKNDQFGSVADTALMQSETGWTPKYTIDEGLKLMCAWASGKGEH